MTTINYKLCGFRNKNIKGLLNNYINNCVCKKCILDSEKNINQGINHVIQLFVHNQFYLEPSIKYIYYNNISKIIDVANIYLH